MSLKNYYIADWMSFDIFFFFNGYKSDTYNFHGKNDGKNDYFGGTGFGLSKKKKKVVEWRRRN